MSPSSLHLHCLFVVIFEMWLCSAASEPGEAAAVFSVILQVSHSSPPSSKMHLQLPGVTSADMPFGRKDEQCHFYWRLKSLIQGCWDCHSHFFKEAKPSIQLRSRASPCSVAGRGSCLLRTQCAVEVKYMGLGARPGTGYCFLLLAGATFFLTSPNLPIVYL